MELPDLQQRRDLRQAIRSGSFVARVYIVSFRTHDDRRPSKFIVLPDKHEIRPSLMAWEHEWSDFQSRFDKGTGQALK